MRQTETDAGNWVRIELPDTAELLPQETVCAETSWWLHGANGYFHSGGWSFEGTGLSNLLWDYNYNEGAFYDTSVHYYPVDGGDRTYLYFGDTIFDSWFEMTVCWKQETGELVATRTHGDDTQTRSATADIQGGLDALFVGSENWGLGWWTGHEVRT